MDGVIEALHIYDEHNAPVLSHVYTGRPLSAAQLLPLYLDQQRQQSSSNSTSSPVGALPNTPSSLFSSSRKQPASLVYIPDTNPPTLVFSIVHASLLFLLTTSSELEPLLALEFLHRVADALEEFLGSPLIAGKIESNYDVVAQLLTEMCDAGTVGTTEPNALHDLVEMEGLVGKLLGSITLPGKAAAALSSAASQAAASSLGTSFAPSSSMSSSSPAALLAASQRSNSPALPWRRANVRHTSNEMYADIIESLSITLAPSGRPLAAFAQGSIAFNSKVSGMPDILLTMSGPTGKHNLGNIIELPVFHPCVRLARWKERPGELSFIPPDGRFILAAYEVDLMPYSTGSGAFSTGIDNSSNLKMPVSVEMKTNLGPTGTEFEVRASVNRTFAFGRSNGASSSGSSLGGGGVRGLGGSHAGSPGAPLLEDLRISVPLPADVRNLLEIRPTRGDAVYNAGEHMLEWHIPAKEVTNGSTSFGLRCTVVGQQRPQHGDFDGDSDNSDSENGGGGAGSDEYGFDRSGGLGFKEYTYDEPYQQPASPEEKSKKKKKKKKGSSKSKSRGDDIDDAAEAAAEAVAEAAAEAATKRRIARNKILMPSSASLSFSVKGWLASGVRIESIVLDTKRSRGLGEGIKPFKGVKYVTVSKGGIELRC
ncbi:adaptor complexes medium subunit family protein [Ophiostoma piceae UAMH 11346]|uniref:Adaptor complexes medium subunit family protein n=1 Tax=Ophiostoma piceae (strain UAMH 11346) TaxID=1262450 RepID=S3CAV5_OPHP1|nr:adaptor complexes medium subunit family protein [Ophiostoma piceae UAMH 11346]